MVCQHDPRHKILDFNLATQCRLRQYKIRQTRNKSQLNQVQSSTYRSQVARCLFLSQNRADMTFVATEPCQRMSNPAHQSLANLKRRVRGDDFFRLGLGRWQGDTEIIMRGRAADRHSHVESTHTKTKTHCEEQRRVRIVRGSIGRLQSRNRWGRWCVILVTR